MSNATTKRGDEGVADAERAADRRIQDALEETGEQAVSWRQRALRAELAVAHLDHMHTEALAEVQSLRAHVAAVMEFVVKQKVEK